MYNKNNRDYLTKKSSSVLNTNMSASPPSKKENVIKYVEKTSYCKYGQFRCSF